MGNFFETAMKLVQAEKDRRGSFRALCEPLALNPTTVQKWFTETKGGGPRAPGIDQIGRILDAMGVQLVLPGQTVRDFARVAQMAPPTGMEGVPPLVPDPQEEEPMPALEFILKKRHTVPDVLFKPELLDQLRVDPGMAVLYKVPDSLSIMLPLIAPGDLLLIDGRRTAVEDGAVYLIRIEGRFVLRHISREPGRLVFSAQRHAAPFYIADSDSRAVDIVGRVVWRGSKF